MDEAPMDGAPTNAPFTAALAPHYEDAARYCRALCARGPAADAEDVLQQALLTALERHAQLRDPARFRPWLFRIVTRTFYAAARRHFWRRFVPLGDVAEREMPAVYATAHPDAEDVLGALGRLTPADRAALLLFEVAGFSLEDVAAIQGDRTVSAVKSRLSRARRRARALLKPVPDGRPADRGAAVTRTLGRSGAGRPWDRGPAGHLPGVERATLGLLDELEGETSR